MLSDFAADGGARERSGGRRIFDSPGSAGSTTPHAFFGSPGWNAAPGRSSARAGGPVRRAASPNFFAGLFAGLFFSWAALLIFGFAAFPGLDLGPAEPHAVLMPLHPPAVAPGGYHAIIVPAGGQGADGPPPHVAARLEQAVKLYQRSAAPKPYIITTAWGTPHKPCPHDANGFERHESSDNAAFLMARGVPPEAILEARKVEDAK